MEASTREGLLKGFPNWSRTPIPNVSLSAGGLLALADLSTVAQRTALTGGSSWLDVLLLVPGLHYQQAADELARKIGGVGGGVITAVEEQPDGGHRVTRAVNNTATVQFIQRIARPSEIVTVDVGALPLRTSSSSSPGRRRRAASDPLSAGVWPSAVWVGDYTHSLGWVSHLLYLITPVFTVAALVLMVLLQDWWGLGFLCAMMLSRILNIWVIKQRAKHTDSPPAPPLPAPSSLSSSGSSAVPEVPEPPDRQTSLLITLPGGRSVRLRGTVADLQAVTVDAWMRAKTHVEGYLEAAAKLLVYLVAAFSGNQTQAGSIVMMSLLLISAGLLALSNAHAKGLLVNGRLAAPILAPTPPEENRDGRRTHSDPLPATQHHALTVTEGQRVGKPGDGYADENAPAAVTGVARRNNGTTATANGANKTGGNSWNE